MKLQIKAEPYRPRETWLIDVREILGWHLKVYGICADGCELTSPIVDAAVEYVAQQVQWPTRESGYGFMTLHFGEQAVWLLVDLWEDDILRHFLFRASLAQPDQFAPGPVDGTMACVWELAVLTHERTAWIEHVLSCPIDPDYQDYLQDCLQITAPQNQEPIRSKTQEKK